MKSKMLITILICIIALGFLVMFKGIVKSGLVSPKLSDISKQSIPITSPSPSSTLYTHIPTQHDFNSSTDLKKELETINPQVLDSDFE